VVSIRQKVFEERLIAAVVVRVPRAWANQIVAEVDCEVANRGPGGRAPEQIADSLGKGYIRIMSV
jgi:hypothetical protein